MAKKIIFLMMLCFVVPVTVGQDHLDGLDCAEQSSDYDADIDEKTEREMVSSQRRSARLAARRKREIEDQEDAVHLPQLAAAIADSVVSEGVSRPAPLFLEETDLPALGGASADPGRSRSGMRRLLERRVRLPRGFHLPTTK